MTTVSLLLTSSWDIQSSPTGETHFPVPFPVTLLSGPASSSSSSATGTTSGWVFSLPPDSSARASIVLTVPDISASDPGHALVFDLRAVSLTSSAKSIELHTNAVTCDRSVDVLSSDQYQGSFRGTPVDPSSTTPLFVCHGVMSQHARNVSRVLIKFIGLSEKSTLMLHHVSIEAAVKRVKRVSEPSTPVSANANPQQNPFSAESHSSSSGSLSSSSAPPPSSTASSSSSTAPTSAGNAANAANAGSRGGGMLGGLGGLMGMGMGLGGMSGDSPFIGGIIAAFQLQFETLERRLCLYVDQRVDAAERRLQERLNQIEEQIMLLRKEVSRRPMPIHVTQSSDASALIMSAYSADDEGRGPFSRRSDLSSSSSSSLDSDRGAVGRDAFDAANANELNAESREDDDKAWKHASQPEKN